LSIVSHSADETRAIGEALGKTVGCGAVVALYGPLGSGKTCFVQGLAVGVGVDSSVSVNSPSYVIINEYPGKRPLYHLDLYRVHDEREVYELGWEDYLDKPGVIAVEWAERLGSLLPERYTGVTFEVTGEYERTLIVEGDDRLLAALRERPVSRETHGVKG
jgi:tRNA threonylcarbamoyladenosine biosynthesis protein TsaE